MKYQGNNQWALEHPDYLENFGDWMKQQAEKRNEKIRLQKRIKKERSNHVRNQSNKSE